LAQAAHGTLAQLSFDLQVLSIEKFAVMAIRVFALLSLTLAALAAATTDSNGDASASLVVSSRGTLQKVKEHRQKQLMRSSKVVQDLLVSRVRSIRSRRHGDQLPHILHVGGRSLRDFTYRNSWQRTNPGWAVDVLTDERIKDLASSRSSQTKELLESGLKFFVEKSDIARLLSLQAEGGVYVDGDVEAKIPIDQWAAHYHYQDKDLDLILGVEFPRTDDYGKNPLQISNFAMAASPANSILSYAIDKIINEAPSIPDTKGNILRRTGPVALTSAILEALQQRYGATLPDMSEVNAGTGHLYHLKEKDGTETKVLILPYRAFCYHPLHGKGVVKNPFSDHLVEHKFFNRWRL